jgi:hypothetical protein
MTQRQLYDGKRLDTSICDNDAYQLPVGLPGKQ